MTHDKIQMTKGVFARGEGHFYLSIRKYVTLLKI